MPPFRREDARQHAAGTQTRNKVQKRLPREEQQRLEKRQRKIEKRKPPPVPANPLERLNVLAQRLGIPPPVTHTAEYRSFTVQLVCKPTRSREGIFEEDGDQVVDRAEGRHETLKEPGAIAAEHLSKILEQQCLSIASDACTEETGRFKVVEDLRHVAGMANAVEHGNNVVEDDVQRQGSGVGDIIMDGDDELISYD